MAMDTLRETNFSYQLTQQLPQRFQLYDLLLPDSVIDNFQEEGGSFQ